jgi:hypothetical protein
MKRLLSEKEAAERVKLSPKYLKKRRHLGGGPPYLKLDRVVRYDPDLLDAWLAERIRLSTSDPGPQKALQHL